jgi:hypothetical protein
MGEAGLKAALARGEPLVEVIVRFRAGMDTATATDQINVCCEDFELHPQPWYGQPRLRVGWATRAALARLFGVTVHAPGRRDGGCCLAM